ncbi:hypothetical protein ZIOFF_063744 [Zingiber officinale]|uniref:Uncharacterized protein n=1 Tax=Zingiber officinale TaxID=94328 RepID=A0A8J5F6E4_ZINOF|nr:hypothetical protein ZIOFF_063744 [Zingiber officinale]
MFRTEYGVSKVSRSGTRFGLSWFLKNKRDLTKPEVIQFREKQQTETGRQHEEGLNTRVSKILYGAFRKINTHYTKQFQSLGINIFVLVCKKIDKGDLRHQQNEIFETIEYQNNAIRFESRLKRKKGHEERSSRWKGRRKDGRPSSWEGQGIRRGSSSRTRGMEVKKTRTWFSWWGQHHFCYIGNEFKLASSRRGLGFYHSRNLAQPSPSASAAAMAQEVSFTLNGAILLGADILLFPLLQHVADLSWRETLARITGGIKVKADRDESSPYAAMLAAQDVVQQFKAKPPAPGGQSGFRALARARMKIGRVDMLFDSYHVFLGPDHERILNLKPIIDAKS